MSDTQDDQVMDMEPPQTHAPDDENDEAMDEDNVEDDGDGEDDGDDDALNNVVAAAPPEESPEDDSESSDEDDNIPVPEPAEQSGPHQNVFNEAHNCRDPLCCAFVRKMRARGKYLESKVDVLEQEKHIAKREARRLKRENKLLCRQNMRRKGGRVHRVKRQWTNMMRERLEGNQDLSYRMIWKQQQKEENMSIDPKRIHPELRLIGPPQDEEYDSDADMGENDSDADMDENDSVVGTEVQTDSMVVDLRVQDAHEVRDLHTPATSEEAVQKAQKPFNFEHLPMIIQERIFKLWLSREGELIHCMSRLDPFVEPDQRILPKLNTPGRGLPHLFICGQGQASLIHDGQNPSEFLRILLVSRRFHFIGTHIFYGSNTFAFSSLGEMGRFFRGIGQARLQRIQHVELNLQGSQHMHSPIHYDEASRNETNPKWMSARTMPLWMLPQILRIKTLVIHLDEQTNIRRKYEPEALQKYQAVQTAGQPISRARRALRSIQGIDAVYTLRGLRLFAAYDSYKPKARGGERNKEYVPHVRRKVADWSFVEDVTNQTGMVKVPVREDASSPGKLLDLLPRRPSEPDNPAHGQLEWELVMHLYAGPDVPWAYDEVRAAAEAEEETATATRGTDEDGTEDGTTTDPIDDSDTDGDSDDDGSHGDLFVRQRGNSPEGSLRNPINLEDDDMDIYGISNPEQEIDDEPEGSCIDNPIVVEDVEMAEGDLERLCEAAPSPTKEEEW